MESKELTALRGQYDQRRTRKRYLETKEGREEYMADMARFFVLLEAYGYKWPSDENDVDGVINVWCDALKDTYVAFGPPGLVRAAKLYAKEDKGYSRRWPSVGQVADLARRDQPALIERINEHKKEQALLEDQEEMSKKAQALPERALMEKIWREYSAEGKETAGLAMIDFLRMKMTGDLPRTLEEYKSKRTAYRA